MSRYLYNSTRYIAIILVISNIITRGVKFEYLRNIYLVSSLVIFLFISVLYEKKRVLFTPTYIVYFVVVFINQNISPYTYIDNKMMLDTIVRNPYAKIPNDHYTLYFNVFICVNIVILIYLLISKRTKASRFLFMVKANTLEAKDILLVSLVFLPVQVILGSTFRKLLIPYCTYFLSSILMFKNIRTRKIYVFGAIMASLIILSQITWRFIAVQYILPIFISIILYKSFITLPRKIKSIEKVTIVLAFVSIAIYGITSEMYKLGSLTSLSDLKNVITNIPLLFSWLDRQGYRIFGIWTVLGGNIIDYANEFGFFYGITYIKTLAPILGFEYISLPTISAQLVGANYAQPGLVGEGYANFGLFGAVFNIIGVLLLLEFIWTKFIKKQSMFNYLLVIIPFTSVLLDGGSLNSMVFNIVVIASAFSLRLLKSLLKGNKIENEI
jgi:hypothetical protein